MASKLPMAQSSAAAHIPLEHLVPDLTFARNPFAIDGDRVVVDDERSPVTDVSAASMSRLRTPFAAANPAPATTDRPERPEGKTVI
ncbi:hypothetical protein ACLQ24_09205 [Micromonospora sp. DT4]|uniref:hypothetical protein n=1 Tax=Micromonospora sp. DT4 TaxID=3393438 RepID=UPI003CEF7247